MLVAATLILALGGASPAGGVIDGGDAMYGATTIGGPHCITNAPLDRANVGCGIVFRLTYDGSGYSVIHAFDGSDGKYPIGPLLLASDGRLYGRTIGGGANGDGVIYSLARDGSRFQVLYAYGQTTYGDVPSLVRFNSGTIYAATDDGQGMQRVIRIAGGTAGTFASFGSGTRILDLRGHDRSIYLLLDRRGRCGSEIERLDGTGAVTPLLSDTPDVTFGTCPAGQYYARILPDGSGGVYALGPGGIDRADRGHVTPFFRLPRSKTNHLGSEGGFPVALSDGLNGRLFVTLTPNFEFNCGTLLSVDVSGRAQALAILPPIDRAPDLTCHPNYEPLLTLAHTGDVYGTTPASDCTSTTSDSKNACGSIFLLRRSGGLEMIHSFGPSLRAVPTGALKATSFYDTLQTTSNPYRFVLTRTSEDRDFTAQTPAPRAIALRSLTTHAVTPLALQGSTMARWIFRPFDPPIPALAYRVPGVSADMYDAELPINGYWSSRVYYPVAHAPPALHDGQRFMALTYSGSQVEAMTNAQGAPLGASPVVLLSHRDNMLRFRATATREMVMVPGRYASAEGIVGLTPIVEDDVVRQLRQRYVGRLVFPRQLSGTCVQANGDTMNMSVSGSLRVHAVYRLYGVAPVLSIDASSADAAAFAAINPLAILFDRPADNRMTFGSGRSSAVTSNPQDCTEYYAFAADPWQVERMVSLHPRVNARWPEAFRKAVSNGTVVVGMTREMVAASIGYPPVYGTSKDFEKLDDWKYEHPAPFAEEVFFRNDRVVRYDPPGNLP